MGEYIDFGAVIAWLASLLIVVGLTAGIAVSCAEKQFQREAVGRGYGEYDHEGEWSWKE